MEFRCAAEVRIRWTLTILNTTFIAFGFIQMTLGFLVNQGLPVDHRTLPPPPPPPPPLWTTGIVTSFIGASGLTSLCSRPTNHQLLVVAWMSMSVLLEVIGYATFSVCGFFDPSKFGVTLHAFADCTTSSSSPSPLSPPSSAAVAAAAAHRRPTAICTCRNRDEAGDAVRALYVIGESGCDVIRRTTILYLCYIIAFIISLLGLLIAVLLAGILVCCLRRCIVKGSPKGLHTAIYGESMRLDTNSPEAATIHTSFTWHRFRSSVDSLDGETGRLTGEAPRAANAEERSHRSNDNDSDHVDK